MEIFKKSTYSNPIIMYWFKEQISTELSLKRGAVDTGAVKAGVRSSPAVRIRFILFQKNRN
jgi:hypothetical protein